MIVDFYVAQPVFIVAQLVTMIYIKKEGKNEDVCAASMLLNFSFSSLNFEDLYI